MISLKRKIRLHETDATGVIYFTNQLKYSADAFEEWIDRHLSHFPDLFEKFALPIIRAESTYRRPLMRGDEIEIILDLVKLGRSSFTIKGTIKKEGVVVGFTEITHVLTSLKDGKATPFQNPFKALLEKCLVDQVSCTLEGNG